MPKLTPDRDDRQGNMAGQGGPQDGNIGESSDKRQQSGGSLEDAGAGAGGQRFENGSSRDSESRH